MFSELGSEYGQKNPKNSPFTPTRRTQIEVPHDEGYTEHRISGNMKDCSKTTVHIAIVNFLISGTVSDKMRSECPKKYSV